MEDGLQAVNTWASAAWDLILMDIQMPVMDGVTATREIRLAEARTGRPRTPIIAISANVMPHQLEDYRAAGMDQIIPKPINATVLVSAMESVLAHDELVEAAPGPGRAAGDPGT